MTLKIEIVGHILNINFEGLLGFFKGVLELFEKCLGNLFGLECSGLGNFSARKCPNIVLPQHSFSALSPAKPNEKSTRLPGLLVCPVF